MKNTSRGVTAVVVTALALALGLTALAPAHTKLYNASVTFSLNKQPGGDTITGKVYSKPLCVGGRTVTVTDDPNTSVQGDQTEIGRTTTNSLGDWSLAVQGGLKKGHTYFASVSKRRLKTDKRHKHTCKGATSPTAIAP